jgi:ribosome-associated protein YbcJ (S4-like RNA binding protein)
MRVVSDLVLSNVESGDKLVMVEDGVVVSGEWKRRGAKLRDGCVLVKSGFEVRVVGVFSEGGKYWCGYIEVEVEDYDEGLRRFDILGPDVWQVCERRH